jgi:hypothetical protein
LAVTMTSAVLSCRIEALVQYRRSSGMAALLLCHYTTTLTGYLEGQISNS